MRVAEAVTMRIDALIVPRGAEARAVARGWGLPSPPLIAVPAGIRASTPLGGDIPLAHALVFGLCGALDPARRVGDVVVYESIVDGSATIALDPGFAALCARALRAPIVPAANVAAFVADAKGKRALAAATGAAAIDMEASAIARTLHARGVRVAMVRVVSDDATTELPDLAGVYDSNGALRPLALALAFARTPARSARFIAHAMSALRALRRTARLVSRSHGMGGLQ